MVKAEEILSRAAGWNAGATKERFPEDAEQNLLDRTERGVVVRPERYGPWQTVYKRFVEWQKSGPIEKIFLCKELHLVETFYLKLKEFRASLLVMISSLTVFWLLSIWLVSVFFLHNADEYSIRNRL